MELRLSCTNPSIWTQAYRTQQIWNNDIVAIHTGFGNFQEIWANVVSGMTVVTIDSNGYVECHGKKLFLKMDG